MGVAGMESMAAMLSMMMGKIGCGKGAVGGNNTSWTCDSCGFLNKPANEVCGGSGHLGCKAPRPPPAVVEGKGKGKGGKGGWQCTACGFKNSETNAVCGGNGPMGCKAEKPEDWLCECGFVNKFSNLVCGGHGKMGCKTPKPTS